MPRGWPSGSVSKASRSPDLNTTHEHQEEEGEGEGKCDSEGGGRLGRGRRMEKKYYRGNGDMDGSIIVRSLTKMAQ